MSEKKRKLLKKLNPDTLVDTVVEIRFQPKIPPAQVVPFLFRLVSHDFPNFQPSEIPLNIRKTQPALNHWVGGILTNENYGIGVGENAVTFQSIGNYKGWNNFGTFIKDYLEKIQNAGIIEKVLRVGLRYRNFFPITDAFKVVNFDIKFEGRQLYAANQMLFQTDLKKDELSFQLTISDGALKGEDRGTLLDIDVSINEVTLHDSNDLFRFIEKLHVEEKYIFEDLLVKEYLTTLKPEYES